MDLSVFTNATFFVFQIWVNNSVVFWYSGMYATKLIRINHDNVASRGAVGRSHIIVRFQTGNRRKDNGTENFVGFVYVLDRFPQRELGLWVFICPTNIILFHGYHAECYHAPSIPHGLPRLYHHCTAITPVYISRLPRQGLPLPIFTTTCYHTRQSSSYFIVHLSPAFTPPVLLTYTTTGRHTLQPPPHFYQ